MFQFNNENMGLCLYMSPVSPVFHTLVTVKLNQHLSCHLSQPTQLGIYPKTTMGMDRQRTDYIGPTFLQCFIFVFNTVEPMKLIIIQVQILGQTERKINISMLLLFNVETFSRVQVFILIRCNKMLLKISFLLNTKSWNHNQVT